MIRLFGDKNSSGNYFLSWSQKTLSLSNIRVSLSKQCIEHSAITVFAFDLLYCMKICANLIDVMVVFQFLG